MSVAELELLIKEVFKHEGWLMSDYQGILYNCVIKSPPGAVVEIGSEQGFSSLALAQACRETGKQFISVDPYPNIVGGGEECKVYYAEHILARYPESIQYNLDILDCIQEIPQELSVVFIDGFHDCANTEREWELLFPRIVPKGWMIMDDIGWTGNQSGIGTGGPALTARRFRDTNLFDLIVDAKQKNVRAGRKI